MRGGQQPASGFTPPAEIGYKPPNRIAFDLDKAKKYLALAGYASGADVPEFTILINTSDQHKAIAEAIQDMWKKHLGIDRVTIGNQEWKVYQQTLKDLKYDGRPLRLDRRLHRPHHLPRHVAHRRLHHNLEHMMQLAREGRRPTVEDRLLYRYQASQVPSRCVYLARELFRVLGGSAIYDEALPFGRICRNLEAAEAHPAANLRSCGRSLGAYLLTGQNEDPMI